MQQCFVRRRNSVETLHEEDQQEEDIMAPPHEKIAGNYIKKAEDLNGEVKYRLN